MRPILPSVVALCVASAASTASANVVYDLSGTFRPATTSGYTTVLGGGSFDGTFTLPGSAFPTRGSTSFASFIVNLRDGTGRIVDTIRSGVSGGGGYVSDAYVSYYGGTILEFYDTLDDDLQLVVASGFTGNGGVLSNGYSYAQAAPSNQATVGNGIVSPHASVRAVAEPSTVSLAAFGSALLLRLFRRRRASGERFFAPPAA